MKSLMNALVAHQTNSNIKPVWIPIPIPRDEEQVSLLAERLELSDDCNFNETEIILTYRSPLGFTLDKDTSLQEVENLAKRLYEFRPEQLESLKNLCRVFNLNDNRVIALINSIV